MTFAEWARRAVPDGRHSIKQWPLDPLHPLRHGRVRVTLDLVAGRVEGCRFDVHANHRGDERLLEVRDVRQGMALLNRHGWLTAPFAEVLYARIVERMLGMRISARAAALRELALALDAAAVEALWTHLEASLTDSPSRALVEREQWLGELELLTGARMHTTYARVGGVASDISEEQLQRLSASPFAAVAQAAAGVASAEGEIGLPLPKVLRLPEGDEYDEIDTPHGVLGVWMFGRGDKVPARVHLRTPGFAALAGLEYAAPGLSREEFLIRLARTRFVPGEVSR